jgi:hypothetical protein
MQRTVQPKPMQDEKTVDDVLAESQLEQKARENALQRGRSTRTIGLVRPSRVIKEAEIDKPPPLLEKIKAVLAPAPTDGLSNSPVPLGSPSLPSPSDPAPSPAPAPGPALLPSKYMARASVFTRQPTPPVRLPTSFEYIYTLLQYLTAVVVYLDFLFCPPIF